MPKVIIHDEEGERDEFIPYLPKFVDFLEVMENEYNVKIENFEVLHEGSWYKIRKTAYEEVYSKLDPISLRNAGVASRENAWVSKEESKQKFSKMHSNQRPHMVVQNIQQRPYSQWECLDKSFKWKLFQEFEKKSPKKSYVLVDDSTALNIIMKELMDEIEPEAYPHNEVNTKNEMFNYLHYTFNRLLYEKKVLCYRGGGSEAGLPLVIVWNTNLSSKDRRACMLCILEKQPSYGQPPYQISFCRKPDWDRTWGKIKKRFKIPLDETSLPSKDIQPAYYFKDQDPNSYVFNPSLDIDIKIQSSKFHLTEDRMEHIRESYEYSKISYRNVCPSIFFPKNSAPQETQLILPVTDPTKYNKVAFGVNLKYDEDAKKYIAVSALPTNSVIRNCRLIHKLDQKWMRYKWDDDFKYSTFETSSLSEYSEKSEKKKQTYLNNHPGTKKILFHFFSLFGTVVDVSKNPKNTLAYVKYQNPKEAEYAFSKRTHLKMRILTPQPDTISIKIQTLSLDKFLQCVFDVEIVSCKYQCQKELVRIKFSRLADIEVNAIKNKYPNFNIQVDPLNREEAFFELKAKKSKKFSEKLNESLLRLDTSHHAPVNTFSSLPQSATPTSDESLVLTFSRSQGNKPDTPTTEDNSDRKSFLSSGQFYTMS